MSATKLTAGKTRTRKQNQRIGIFAGVLSSSLLTATAWAAPTVIEEVSVQGTSSGVRIDLRGDGAMSADGARVKTDSGMVYLYVRGTRVHADRRSWNTDEGLVQAHRHRGEIELVVPTGGRACAADASFEISQTGLSATLVCSGGSGGGRQAERAAARAEKAAEKAAAKAAALESAPEAPRERAAKIKETVAQAAPAALPAALPQAGAVEADERAALAALVALPKEGQSAAPVVKAVQAGQGTTPAAGATNGATKVTQPVLAQAAAVLAKADAVAKPAAKPEVAKPEGALTAEAATTGLGEGNDKALGSAASSESTTTSHASLGPTGPLFLLAAFGVGAALWWRKRKGFVMPKRIQIKETASIGPKRSLVVAEIDGERLILASSEAGITLLRSEGPSEAPRATKVEPGTELVFLPREAKVGATTAAPAATNTIAATGFASALSEAESQALTSACAAALSSPSPLSGSASVSASAFLSAPTAPTSVAPAAVSAATSALFAGIPSRADEPAELEGAASGLAKLRALAGGLSQSSRPKGAQARAEAERAEKERKAEKERNLEDDWFVDALEDSVEDQELRAKLAMGVGGRVK